MNFFCPDCGAHYKLYLSTSDPKKPCESEAKRREQITELQEELVLTKSIAIDFNGEVVLIADYQEINQ